MPRVINAPIRAPPPRMSGRSDNPASEETPLIPPTNRRRTSQCSLNAINIYILVAVAALVILFLYLWGEIARERVQWQQELKKRRLEEQARVDEWEHAFDAEKERNRCQIDEWQQELKERRLDEQSRIDKWERAFNATQERNRRQLDQFQRDLMKRNLEEQYRINRWESTFNATLERNRRQMDKWRREEEEVQRLGLYWDEPIADSHCTGYNTREYWARLLNTVPYDYNWLKPCEDIPIIIHGKAMKASRCYINPLVSGEVIGHWLVDFNEPLCTPFFQQLEDKGCVAEGSGRRRFLAHLVNYHDGEDGEKLCASTPFDFRGRHFDKPQSCVNWGKTGIYGFWEIDDSSC